MILDSNEIDARVSSPLNLMNRLRALSGIPSIPDNIQNGIIHRKEETTIPSIPSVDDLVESVDDKINKGKAVSGAKAVMAESINRLRQRLIEVDNPVQLSKIATDMHKIVNAEVENRKPNNAPIVIWKPEMHQENHYETVVVSE